MKKKLLWVGDAACPSGFAKATHAILESVRQHYDVTVLGINYRGDPHDYPYPIYTAAAGGDMFGVGRLVWMCDLVKPDVIVVQNDGWNFPAYVKRLAHFPEYAKVPLVAIVAVDGLNFDGQWLDGVSHAVFWTQFALNEARVGGYTGPASVIPLGVDTAIYRPNPSRTQLPERFKDAFILGNVNRNQPRKRWDLTLKYFARFVEEHDANDAFLYLHVAPTGDTGVDVKRLAQYYGVFERLLLREPPTWYGVPEEEMARTYNLFNAAMSTTQGEGFGLTALEAMACGVPCVLPKWSAFGEWARGAAYLVPCTSTAIGPPYVNVIGGVPDEEEFVRGLAQLYDLGVANTWASRALETARRSCYRWDTIGKSYVSLLDALVMPTMTEEVWQDLGRAEEVVQ